ncbi:MAG: MBL fold metallo-hydrolase [Bacteroidetes bacterium]|nr:MBL fold metallo-hydrolase [Bacteroidota bacterium]
MKPFVLTFLFVACLTACRQNEYADLNNTEWIHGSPDCTNNQDPPIQAVACGNDTWIFRQNKCIHYEAPFMFLFEGQERALLIDTGAPFGNRGFPLEEMVRSIIKEKDLIVAHTHTHGDHHGADSQFAGKPHTTVIGWSQEQVQTYFGLTSWPEQTTSVDLGNRTIEIIPIPGHDTASVAFYDPVSRWLLTGDSFYPGRLYVRDWDAFRRSIMRLSDFCLSHQVEYLLGNHIEMTMTFGKDYPTGTTFQPEEHPLPLRFEQLRILRDSLKLMDTPARKVFDEFIVEPVMEM